MFWNIDWNFFQITWSAKDGWRKFVHMTATFLRTCVYNAEPNYHKQQQSHIVILYSNPKVVGSNPTFRSKFSDFDYSLETPVVNHFWITLKADLHQIWIIILKIRAKHEQMNFWTSVTIHGKRKSREGIFLWLCRINKKS